ncbi:MAG: ice-binding family protein [Solirubrobacteraceae bacterium]
MTAHTRHVRVSSHSASIAVGLLLAGALMLATPLIAGAQAAAVGLGTDSSFAVLAGSTVTNTGPSVISGSVGLDPGSAVTGFPPGLVNAGTIHISDAVALQAKSDLVTAYDDAAGRSSTATVSGDLAGRTLVSGVYSSASELGLSGDLTLDGQGNPNAVFVFQAGSTLTAGSSSRVLLIGGAQPCNVFWEVGSSATIGTASQFAGNIIALTSITMNTGATLQGRVLARNGAVTLDDNVITAAQCSTTPPTGSTSPSPTTPPTGSTPPAGTTPPSGSLPPTATATAPPASTTAKSGTTTATKGGTTTTTTTVTRKGVTTTTTTVTGKGVTTTTTTVTKKGVTTVTKRVTAHGKTTTTVTRHKTTPKRPTPKTVKHPRPMPPVFKPPAFTG